jgi:hypothetical protein
MYLYKSVALNMYFEGTSYEEFRRTLWRTADGKACQVCDLDTSHVANILNWIRDHPTSYEPGLYGKFEDEIQSRQIVDFANGGAVAVKENDTWKMSSPEAEAIRINRAQIAPKASRVEA